MPVLDVPKLVKPTAQERQERSATALATIRQCVVKIFRVKQPKTTACKVVKTQMREITSP